MEWSLVVQTMKKIGYTKKWEEIGRPDGIKIGEARGEDRGIEQTLRVIKMLKDGASVEQISKVPYITLYTEEIENIAASFRSAI